jgi:hypothetical protein
MEEKFMIEMTKAERDAFLTVAGTLERKASKGAWWAAKLAPVKPFIQRVKDAKPVVP